MTRQGCRLSIVLNDPGRRNALNVRLREALLVADSDETIADVEISGAGPAFCSGGDLDEFGTATDLVAAYLVRLACAPWRVIDRISDRVTMRVHGVHRRRHRDGRLRRQCRGRARCLLRAAGGRHGPGAGRGGR
jgi:enoyl-CoA hydratase/carnithine racemase